MIGQRLRAACLVFFVSLFVFHFDVAAKEPRLSDDVAKPVSRAISLFLKQGYLNGSIAKAERYEDFYASRLEKYWNKRNVPLSYVIADKKRFLRRWPRRRYRIVKDSLLVYRLVDSPGVYAIRFDYDFDVRRRNARRSGLGSSELLLRFDGKKPVILRETGRVMKRY